MKKRIFSLLVVLCLAIGLLPAVAYAAEEPALPEAIVEKLGATTYTGEYYSYDLVGDQKLTTHTGDLNMQIAMKFTAKDSAEEAAAHYYAGYTTDFYVEINGLANGEAIGNGCYLAGYYASYGMWVKIPLDGFTIENGKVYPVITSAGFDFDYAAICKDVVSFTCGIYFSEEFMAANPDIEVTLSMGLSETYEQAVNAEFITVEEYVYNEYDLTGKCTHAYDNDFDATCNKCGETRTVEEGLIVTAENKLQLADSDATHIYHRVVVYYLGNQTVEDITDEAALKAIDPNAETLWKENQINAKVLSETGNYVLAYNYNDTEQKGKKVTVYIEASVAVPELLLPEVEVNGHKLVTTAGDASIINYRAVVYYLGNETVADINNEAALKAIDPTAKTSWGLNEINKIQLLEGGNYVVHLSYNVGTGVKQTVAKAFTVDFDELTLKVINGKLVAADPNNAYIYHRAVVYYLGDETVEDIYNEAALKAIDSAAKTHWRLDVINKAKLTQSGNYVVMLHYNLPNSPKMTIAVSVTI